MRFVIFLLIYLLGPACFPQVGINTSSPKAQLDVIAQTPESPSVTDGILIPRVERFPVANPTADQHGMLIFLNTGTTEKPSGFYYWDNGIKAWETISGSALGNFHKPGTSINPNNISDPVFRIGNVGIGTGDISAVKLKIAIGPETNSVRRGLEIDNNNPAADNLTTYGIISDNRSAGNGVKYGIKTNVGGLGNGIHYGIFNETYQNSGTSDIYGIFNRVGRTFGGSSNNYGIFSQIGTPDGQGNIYGIYTRAEGNDPRKVFAAYFAGRIGIGQTPAEEYILPATRGKNEQILKLDNTNIVKWSYPGYHNYSSTTSATGDFEITEEIYTLRINNSVSGIIIPPASENKGRIIVLIGWPGITAKSLLFTPGDDLLDIATNTSVIQITGRQVYRIQSAGNRWVLLGN